MRRAMTFDPLGAAILQHDAELVRGEAADAVPAPQRAADAPADNGDDLVADVVAVGLVDQGEIVDAGKQERALDRLASRGAEEAGQLLGQPGAIELAGELVVIAEIEQPLFLAAAAIVDEPERALRQARPRFGVDRADPGVLDPHRSAAAASVGKEAIAEAVAQLGPGREDADRR